MIDNTTTKNAGVTIAPAERDSLVLERGIVDPSRHDERFPQFFPSSDLTARWTNPWADPTFVHRHITHRGCLSDFL